jgi:hypothetical protein
MRTKGSSNIFETLIFKEKSQLTILELKSIFYKLLTLAIIGGNQTELNQIKIS